MLLGKRLVDTILGQHGKWPKTLPKVTDRAVATAIGEYLMHHETSFFVRVEIVDKEKGILMVRSFLMFYFFIHVCLRLICLYLALF